MNMRARSPKPDLTVAQRYVNGTAAHLDTLITPRLGTVFLTVLLFGSYLPLPPHLLTIHVLRPHTACGISEPVRGEKLRLQRHNSG